jgi:hypothetical protein
VARWGGGGGGLAVSAPPPPPVEQIVFTSYRDGFREKKNQTGDYILA